MDPKLLDQYLAGATALHPIVEGLTREQLLAFPVPGTWSIQQIVLHVVDSDLIGSDRMKRVIAEDSPSLTNADENLWVANLHYHEADASLACRLFELNRRQTHDILRRLPAAAFARSGIHSQRGPLTLEQLVAGFVGHLEGHLKFAREKRAMVTR